MKEKLKAVQSAETNNEDGKIAKKRMKKKGVPEEVTLLQRKQEKNLLIAQDLVREFHEKMETLGWKLNTVLRFSPDGIKPGFELQPLSPQEVKRAEARQEVDNIQSQLEKQKSELEKDDAKK